MDNSNNRISNSNNEIGNYNNGKYSNHNKYIVALKRNEYWNGELFDSKAAALQAAKEQKVFDRWIDGNDLRYCFSICNIEKVEVSSIGD